MYSRRVMGCVSSMSLWPAWRKRGGNSLDLERAFNTLETPKESAFWLNKFIRTYWEDSLEPLLADILYKQLNKKVQKARPSFIKSIHFDSFTLGTNPPRADNFRIHGSTSRDVQSLEFDVDFTADDFRWILRAIGSEEFRLIKGVNFKLSMQSRGALLGKTARARPRS